MICPDEHKHVPFLTNYYNKTFGALEGKSPRGFSSA